MKDIDSLGKIDSNSECSSDMRVNLWGSLFSFYSFGYFSSSSFH